MLIVNAPVVTVRLPAAFTVRSPPLNVRVPTDNTPPLCVSVPVPLMSSVLATVTAAPLVLAPTVMFTLLKGLPPAVMLPAPSNTTRLLLCVYVPALLQLPATFICCAFASRVPNVIVRSLFTSVAALRVNVQPALFICRS